MFQAYPDTKKMIMNMRSIQADSLFILTSIRPAFRESHRIGIEVQG